MRGAKARVPTMSSKSLFLREAAMPTVVPDHKELQEERKRGVSEAACCPEM